MPASAVEKSRPTSPPEDAASALRRDPPLALRSAERPTFGDGSFTGRRDEKRGALTAAGWLAALSGAGPAAAKAGITTITTTQQYATTMSSSDTTASFDVLFTPVENATDLVSISAGSVYTGEGAVLTIQGIASDNTTVTLFDSGTSGFLPFFQTDPLSTITNDTFTDFSAREIKGLRFTLEQFNPFLKPSLTLPVGTDFVISSVPEPGTGVMLACSLAAVLISRRFTRLMPAHLRR